MDQIDRRIALRTQFMNELYDIAQGAVGQPISTSEVAERMGFDFNNNDEHRSEISNMVNYLDQVRLVERIGMGASGVMLTSKGVDEVEKAKRRPDQPTTYFAPFNLVIAHTITQSPIQQASPGATQSLTVIDQSTVQTLEALLQDVKNSLNQLGLSSEDQAELEAEIGALEAQAASPKPKREIIRPALQSVMRILERPAEQALALGLLQTAQNIMNNL